MQLATPAPCSTGSWTQKWECGLHEPANTSLTHAGYATGKAAPIVIGIIVVLLFLAYVSRSRKRSAATSN